MPKYQELNQLKGRMRTKKKTYRAFSEETGIPLNTLSNKLNGHSLFDIVEVAKLCGLLDISPEEIPIYFAVSWETQQIPT